MILKPTKMAKRRTRGIPTPNPTPRPTLAEKLDVFVAEEAAVAELKTAELAVDVGWLAEDEFAEEDEVIGFFVILK
jgi:hypothetical protein